MEEREEYKVKRKKDTEGHHVTRANMKFTLESGRVINFSGKSKSTENAITLDIKENGKSGVQLDTITLKELRALFLAAGEAMGNILNHDEDAVIDITEVDAGKYHRKGF